MIISELYRQQPEKRQHADKELVSLANRAVRLVPIKMRSIN
jgi:hypothetical protein